MKGILKNEFIKLFARREIVILLVASLFLPLFICLALTAGEKEDPAKYIDLPENYYQNRISTAERLLEQTDPDDSSEAAVLLKEIKLCELLQTKDVFSTYTWQFTIAELSLRAGFDEEASEAIESDDYRYYYDKLIALSPVESKKDLFKKLKSLDVYPDYTDYRYLLALRISDDADTPEDKLLLHRIENDMPERPLRGSYAAFVERFFDIITLTVVILGSFVSSYAFAADRKYEVAHPSVILPGRGRIITGKILILVLVLILAALLSFAFALAAGRVLPVAGALKEARLTETGEIVVRPFFDTIARNYFKSQAAGAVSAGVSGFLSFVSKSELAGIAVGGVIALLLLVFNVAVTV